MSNVIQLPKRCEHCGHAIREGQRDISIAPTHGWRRDHYHRECWPLYIESKKINPEVS